MGALLALLIFAAVSKSAIGIAISCPVGAVKLLTAKPNEMGVTHVNMIGEVKQSGFKQSQGTGVV